MRVEEPPNEVVWLPMETESGWAAILAVASDLLDAGYPGCLGAAGRILKENGTNMVVDRT